MSPGEWVVTLLVTGGGGALIAEAIRGAYQRRNMNANYAQTISQSAMTLLVPLRARVDELEGDLDAQETRAADLTVKLEQALAEVNSLRDALAEATAALREALREIATLRAALGEEPRPGTG